MNPYTDWDALTSDELRTAAKVARACGGEILPAAAEVWDRRADEKESK